MTTITMDSVESSQIEAVGYAAESQTLAIQFKAKGTAPGSLYHYSNFSPADWEVLRAAESIGATVVDDTALSLDEIFVSHVID